MYKVIQIAFELIGWIKIALSPCIISTALGIFIYSTFPNIITLSAAVVLSLIGIGLGIYLANKAWRKEGTMNFLSRPLYMPELERKPTSESSN
jgi:hypothetical protein